MRQSQSNGKRSGHTSACRFDAIDHEFVINLLNRKIGFLTLDILPNRLTL